MIESLLFVFAGLLLGVLTGLAPGLHSNLAVLLLLSLGLPADLNLILLVVS
ncbi:hypothetical protein HZB89_01405, partial [archaeon]|nr:hypothetical protein [archaeon]